MSISKAAFDHYHKISQDMGFVSMPEWQIEGETSAPCFFFKPMTLYENTLINQNVEEYQTDYNLELVLLKLLDRRGNRVFKSEDREILEKYGIFAHFLKINKAIADYFSKNSYEEIEKNSDKIVN